MMIPDILWLCPWNSIMSIQNPHWTCHRNIILTIPEIYRTCHRNIILTIPDIYWTCHRNIVMSIPNLHWICHRNIVMSIPDLHWICHRNIIMTIPDLQWNRHRDFMMTIPGSLINLHHIQTVGHNMLSRNPKSSQSLSQKYYSIPNQPLYSNPIIPKSLLNLSRSHFIETQNLRSRSNIPHADSCPCTLLYLHLLNIFFY